MLLLSTLPSRTLFFINIKHRLNVIARLMSSLNETQEKYIFLNSQKINYLKVGKGPKKLVCFPGSLGTIWTDFKPQIQGLNQEEFTIIVWEQPGHGKSRPPERIYTPDFYEEDADIGYKFIKAIGLESFSLLGWSDGGNAGLILAAKYPEVVDKAVVWGSCSYITKEDLKIYEAIRDIKTWSDNVKLPLLDVYGEKLLQEMQYSISEVNKVIFNRGGDIYSTLLEYIKCPTLILHGAKDPLISLEHAEYLQKNIRDAKIFVFPNGKHNIHLRYANEFNKIVTNFLLSKGNEKTDQLRLEYNHN